MSEAHEGGCLCGDVRYGVVGRPVRTSVCHCLYCQRRTGSAFAVLPFFREEQVTLLRGSPATWRHLSDESGRWLDSSFCPRCGSGLLIRVERAPGLCGVEGGSFDSPGWFGIDRHIWTRSRRDWVALPAAGCDLLERG